LGGVERIITSVKIDHRLDKEISIETKMGAIEGLEKCAELNKGIQNWTNVYRTGLK